jgi:recombination protein RecA
MASVPDENREAALELVLERIERQFGKGAVMRLGNESFAPIEAIPTGSIALDAALGIGGLPRGRVVEIFGPESAGKTSIALHAVANAQKAGGNAAFIDAEHVLDPAYAKSLGVDTDALLISQPDDGEQALEIADMLIRSYALDVIVIDSVAALVPRAEIEGLMGESHVGLQARLMSQALRKLAGAIRTSTTTVIFINQLREKIGVQFGSPETTTGGRALKFYASIRLDVRRIDTLKNAGESIGSRTRVKVVKNKCLAEGSRVFDPVTGVTHRIEDVVDQRKPIHVVAAAHDGTLHVRPVISWLDQGVKEVLRLSLADGSAIRMTPEHKVLTDRGWRSAGELRAGDCVARPRRFGVFGGAEPISADDARLLGYLIGDGHLGDETSITNNERLRSDTVAPIGAGLGYQSASGSRSSLSDRSCLRARGGSPDPWGRSTISTQRARDALIPDWAFVPGISAGVVGNLIAGLFESAGRVNWADAGALRVEFTTASEQLAHQIHWLLLRLGVRSTVGAHDSFQAQPHRVDGQAVWGNPANEVRITGTDNIEALAAAIPVWDPRSGGLASAMVEGSERSREPVPATTPLPEYLDRHGREIKLRVGSEDSRAQHRAHQVHAGANAYDHESGFRAANDVGYSVVREVRPAQQARTFDIEVGQLHTFVADDVVVHNCAPPFRQAEFDLLYGKGISREGSLIDLGIEHGLLRKSGAWYTYESDQLGQGKENARAFLHDSPDIAEEIEKKIREKLGIGPGPSIEIQTEF